MVEELLRGNEREVGLVEPDGEEEGARIPSLFLSCEAFQRGHGEVGRLVVGERVLCLLLGRDDVPRLAAVLPGRVLGAPILGSGRKEVR